MIFLIGAFNTGCPPGRISYFIPVLICVAVIVGAGFLWRFTLKALEKNDNCSASSASKVSPKLELHFLQIRLLDFSFPPQAFRIICSSVMFSSDNRVSQM
ncbi:hypothetical protein D3C71_1843440 [compost metagenome]